MVLMGRDKGGVTHTMILWVAGTLITLFVFIVIIWPWLLSVWYGSCWSDARSDLRGFGREIEGAIRSPYSALDYRLSIGSCIAGVVFINGRDDPNIPKFVTKRCEGYDGYKSYMILIPEEYPKTLKSKDVPESLKDKLEKLKDSISVWGAIELWINDKLGRIPSSYCYEFEHDFTTDERSIKSIPEGFYEGWLNENNWNTGSEPYCLRVSYRETTGGGYNYHITQETCPAKAPEGEEG